ncbi:MAG TPA: tetratricopeptide repeat protein [Gemmatimonadales bacterium]|nr:tetratricopeptide repeat protein [Gemmatimonadales bacterium]
MRLMRGTIAIVTLLGVASPLQAQGRSDAKIDSLEHQLLTDSADADLHYALGQLYIGARRYDEADRALRRAIEIEPRFAQAHLAISYLPFIRDEKLWKAVNRGKVPRAQEPIVEEARRFRKTAYMIDPLVNSGVVLVPWWVKMQISEAERAKLPPFFFVYRGLVLARAQEWTEAVSELQEGLLRMATDAAEDEEDAEIIPLVANEVRYVMAVVEMRSGRTVAATRHFQEVLTNDLGMYMAHVRLAEIHEKNGAWRSAIAERQRALDTSPDDPSLVYDLGVTLARAGLLHQADTTLTRALELNVRNPRIPRMAGLVRHQLGDVARAREAYERFLAIAPSSFGREIGEVKEKLATLP